MNDTNTTEVSETTETVTEFKTGINWGKVLVRDASGAPDLELTLLYLREEAAEHITSNEISNEVIDAAVKTVYEKMGTAKNKTLDLASLTYRALNVMNIEGASESKLAERVKNFLRGETKAFEESNGEEGRYVIQRGPNKGCAQATPDFVAAYRAAQAKKAEKTASK